MTNLTAQLPLTTAAALAAGQLADKYNRAAHIAHIWNLGWVATHVENLRNIMLVDLHADALAENDTRP